MSKQEKLDDSKNWRDILDAEEKANKTESDFPKLELTAGTWEITFLDEGTAYSFERNNETKYGISFVVNAKQVSSGGNFPNVSWGVTAKSILKLLRAEGSLTGGLLKLVATGQNMQRRYPSKTFVPPKVKPKA